MLLKNKMATFVLMAGLLALFFSATLFAEKPKFAEGPKFAEEPKKITLFAAASLSNALTDMINVYESTHHIQIQTAFASSASLAKQIEHGAPVDIFIAADLKWMDYLDEKNLILSKTKQHLLNNRLVLIAPKENTFQIRMDKNFNFANAFKGKLCTGEIDAVPVGIYAKQSLTYYAWWDGIKARIVGTQDVRGALAFVERGECAAGIVYETDAKISNKVSVIAAFPENSHEKIIYPMALTRGADNLGASTQAADFYAFLNTSLAKTIFAKYGFTTANPTSLP